MADSNGLPLKMRTVGERERERERVRDYVLSQQRLSAAADLEENNHSYRATHDFITHTHTES